MKKKGDLSMNMIIIAAISLLVLAIIAYLIFGASGNIKDGTSCSGECVSKGSGCPSKFPVPATGISCDDGEVCCISLGTSDN